MTIWKDREISSGLDQLTTPLHLLTISLEASLIHREALDTFLSEMGRNKTSNYAKSLKCLYLASNVYASLSSAEVDLSIGTFPLHEALWVPASTGTELSMQQALACVTLFDTGTINLDPDTLNDVLAISSGNLIYASETLFCDPFLPPSLSQLHCLIANVGKPGLALLLASKQYTTRPLELDSWQLVNHTKYDGKFENNFGGTSLHLILTGYEQAISSTRHGNRDKEVYYLEVAISVYNHGGWVADVDVLFLAKEALLSKSAD